MALVINEIAWMGTRANPGSEWIELYNPGGDPINLSDWILRSEVGPLEIDLTGNIPAGGYFLLERGYYGLVDITADQIYMGSPLNDQGEYLQLIDPTGNVIDTANRQGGAWPAGNASTYCSMERGGFNLPDTPNSWITNIGLVTAGRDSAGYNICGTPKMENWAYSVTSTSTRTLTPTSTPTSTHTSLPARTITPTRTPYRSPTPYPTRTSYPTRTPYRSPTPTRTPKRSPTPTRDPYAIPPSSVVLNEFLTQPRTDWNGDGKINTGDEFIEIINLGNQPITLTDWSLDDQQGDSPPFKIGSLSIQPKAHLAFFNSETGILLSNGGDSVRLFKANGQISDAFTYGVILKPDQTWCRLPDGSSSWVFGCEPTVTESNRLNQNVIVGNQVESAICLSKTLPQGVRLAECDSVGLSAWDSDLWEALPAYPRYFEAGTDVYILD